MNPNNIDLIILIALSIVNIAAFIMVGADKKNSLKGNDRYPEVFFFLMSAIFGSLGVFLGIFTFRHKTRKAYFSIGIGLILIQQIILLTLLNKLY